MELTQKETIFAETVASGRSYSDAYRFAYEHEANVKPLNIGRAAWIVAKKPHVVAKIQELQAEAAKGFKITRDWLMNWHYMRMTYDAGELARLIKGACRHCHGDGFQYQWTEAQYLAALATAEADNAPLPDIGGGWGYDRTASPHVDCPECGGLGISVTDFGDTLDLSPAGRAAFEGVKVTQNGIEIKMADKHAAALAVAKLAGLDVEQVRHFGAIPDDAVLASLTAEDAAQTYKRIMGTAH